MEHFKKLSTVDVNAHVKTKKNLTYLSWPWAWGTTKKMYPDANYKILTFENNLPYIYDENTGYMVFTEVTIEEVTHQMWLPVMDGANKAMKAESYTYSTKYGEKTVEAATMFDINKTIMRCLVKNLGMFGVGLYIYAGEDIPEADYDSVIEALNGCKTKKEVLAVWNANPNLKNDAKFIAEVKAKGEELESKPE